MIIGDLVTRKSYGEDLYFFVNDINDNIATIISIDYRLIATAPVEDLVYTQSRNNSTIKKIFEKASYYFNDSFIINHFFQNRYPTSCGLVLHIDGDKFYLKECLALYKKLRVNVKGFAIDEIDQPKYILPLLNKYTPNILVVTGHDSINKNSTSILDINSYKNSKYFIDTVKIARNYNNDYNNLIIIAGGCQSYYEALINAGANFASSPKRMLINITDPVYIACEFAKTSNTISLDMDILYDYFSFANGSIGGIKTNGQCK